MRRLLLSVALALLATPAAAQGWDLSAVVRGESDHVDRGLTLSGSDPAATATLYLDHESGLYGSLSLSRVNDRRGNDGRVEGVVGHRFALGAYTLDLSAAVDGFFGADGYLYPEFQARISRDLGLFYAAGGIAYAPDGRWFLRNRASVYGWLETEVPVPRLAWLAATAHVGRESLAGARDRTDWGLGLVASHDRFDVSLAYEDSNARLRIGRARVVVALSLYF
ncbi:MAG: TorF family putative porin [Rhodothalassiaceae bacterium]